MSRSAGYMLSEGCPQISPPSQAALAMKTRKVNAVAGVLKLWGERSSQRRELRELADAPDEVFKDVGLSRYDVRREASKYFWQE